MGLPIGCPTMKIPGARKDKGPTGGRLEDDDQGPRRELKKLEYAPRQAKLKSVEPTILVNLVGCELPRPSLLYKGWEGRRSRDTLIFHHQNPSEIDISPGSPL